MQNYQTSFKRITNDIIGKYEDFFLLNDSMSGSQNLMPDMPLFQKQLFLTQAIKNKLTVDLQLVPSTTEGRVIDITGQIVLDKNGKRLLKTGSNVTYFINITQLRYIQRHE